MLLQLSPDLGIADFNAHFAAANPFRLQVVIAELAVAAGPEGDPRAKGPRSFRLTLGGTVYEMPQSLKNGLRGKMGGRIFWKTDTESGQFRYHRDAPPVFDEQEQPIR